MVAGPAASLRDFTSQLKRAIGIALEKRHGVSSAIASGANIFDSSIPPENLCWVGGSLAAECSSDQLARTSVSAESYAASSLLLDEDDLRRKAGSDMMDDEDGDRDTFVVKSFEKISVTFGAA